MDKHEVVKRLKEHLRARKQQNGELKKGDLLYCITYVMDFLLIEKEQAKQFVAENIPDVAKFC
jgi:hypothetical protein